MTISTPTTPSPTIESDITLILDHFFLHFKIPWEEIKWVYNDEVSEEWLNMHENVNLQKNSHPIFYSPTYKTIVLDKKLVIVDWVRFHEMGHMIHHILFDFKKFSFPKKFNFTSKLYWDMDINNNKHQERFADIYSDTVLRLKYNKALFDYNKKMMELLGGVPYCGV